MVARAIGWRQIGPRGLLKNLDFERIDPRCAEGYQKIIVMHGVQKDTEFSEN